MAVQADSPITGCIAMPSQEHAVQEWASRLEELHIEAAHFPQGVDDRSYEEETRANDGLLTSMGRMNNVLGDMAHNLKAIHTTNVQEAAKKTPGWGKFDEAKQLMFLRFASRDGRNWDKTPSKTLQDFLSLSTAAEAHEYMTQRLFRRNIRSSISQGMVSAIKMGSLISTENGECKNLSVFLCPKRAYVIPMEKALTMGLQKAEGKGIGIEGIRELASQELSFPEDNKDCRNFINIFVHVVQEITTEDSYVFRKLQALANTLILEEDTLEDFQAADNNFYTKLLFYLNKRVQMYLSLCYFNEIDVGPDIHHLNFSALLEMIQGNHFSVEIPPVLHRSLVKFRIKNGTMTTVKTESKHPPKRQRQGLPELNQNPYPQLLMRQEENFNAVIMPYLKHHREEIPRHKDGCPVCLHFHLLGVCTDACLFRSTHELLLPKTVNDCQGFLHKARNALESP